MSILAWMVLGLIAGFFEFVPLVGPLTVAILALVLALLIGLVAFGWFIYLLWTTYSSPTKQGFHDKQATSLVITKIA